jgi:4-hydroxyphenylpyruvate dioxygenase
VRHGIATVCLSGTLQRKLTAAAHAGFDGIELFEPDLAEARLSPAHVRDVTAALGVSIDLFQPFRDFEGVTPAQLQRNLARARATFDVMAQLGADTLLVCSNVAPDAIDDDDLAAEQLRALADSAAAHGVRVAYEALAWGRHVSEYDHAWRLVRAADHPALGICLDSFHVLALGTGLDAIAQIPQDKLFFCQLADATDLAVDVVSWSRHHRCLPGQGAFDRLDFTTRVLETGYDGPLSLEVFSDALRHADPELVAGDARRSLRRLEDALLAPALALAAAQAPHDRCLTSPEREGDGGHHSG